MLSHHVIPQIVSQNTASLSSDWQLQVSTGEKTVNLNSKVWQHHHKYVTEAQTWRRGMECLPECLSVGRPAGWSFGLPFYGVLVRPVEIWFQSPRRSQAALLTAGFIWCGRPVLGFSAGFNIWSPLWPEQERMPVDDWQSRAEKQRDERMERSWDRGRCDQMDTHRKYRSVEGGKDSEMERSKNQVDKWREEGMHWKQVVNKKWIEGWNEVRVLRTCSATVFRSQILQRDF